MTAWVLYVLFVCGPGCVEVTARVYHDQQSCARQQHIADHSIAWCVQKERIDG